MADKKESPELAQQALPLAKQVFDTLWSAVGPHDAWHWVLLAVVLLVGLTVMLKALVSVLEVLVKLFEGYKSSGLPLWLTKDNQNRVRRRKQFCKVLDADLAYIAKAESWNDQYFTDLEAEVETEGGYYASALDRLRGRKSFGLRKERSLIRAITSSTERALQLVGEPGSGKSVALRHLAKQLAEQGQRSNDKAAKVPLYVNLREFDARTGPVTADAVRAFVIDNIRRGDADTSAFMRENWSDYRTRGIWLFLFDSFDEIPAVLHAEAGSGVIRQYSEAIRQFLDGMGECQGVLASREFKGPEALPWKKLRILPLSGEKQDELIRNSFLTPEAMGLVRRHLASADSSIGATPLFLTLLCRYVREEGRAPDTDHDILTMHVERLARREPDYLQRQYAMSVAELLEGAERLARLFAEDAALSLAPTVDQIAMRLGTEAVPGGSIQRLLAALVDTKIGRADVPNAAPGDRRFAFAHRRYQEALFVRYLARHPDALTPQAMLTDPRWREYTVTLLQTHTSVEMQGLLGTAQTMLEQRAAAQCAIPAPPPLPATLGYFAWHDEPAVPLLVLLQEGLARRVREVPAGLSDAVHAFLGPRWTHGDDFDRTEVIRLGGLLPQPVLIDCLSAAFADGTRAQRAHAFQQSAFVTRLPDAARDAVLRMLSDQVLQAHDRAAQLNLEALGARLPATLGAHFVVVRCSRLRRRMRWMDRIFKALVPSSSLDRIFRMGNFVSGVPFSARQQRQVRSATSTGAGLMVGWSLLLLMMCAFLAVILTSALHMPDGVRLGMMLAPTLVTLGYLLLLSPFVVRAHGGSIRVLDVPRWTLRKLFKRATWIVGAGVIGVFAMGGAIFWSVGYGIDLLFHGHFGIALLAVDHPTFSHLLFLGLIPIVVVAYFLGFCAALWDFPGQRRRAVAQRAQLAQAQAAGLAGIAVLQSAESLPGLLKWLDAQPQLLDGVDVLRAYSSHLLACVRDARGTPPVPLPPSLTPEQGSGLRLIDLRQLLEVRLEAWAASGHPAGGGRGGIIG